MLRIPKTAFIVLSLVFSFFISSFIYSHYFNASPEFNAGAVKDDVQNIFTSISSFHLDLPQFNLISFNTPLTPTPVQSEVPEPTMEYDNVPTEVPTSTPYIQPTKGSVIPTYSQQPTRIPTKPPNQLMHPSQPKSRNPQGRQIFFR